MTTSAQRLTVGEKLGYSCGDAAANFVFMSMILFQASFYTDVFGISAGAAASILMIARLWDAFFDPIMGVLADRTRTRWGRFRPWILWTAGPWAAVMILAYTTPKGWSMGALILYASITNTLLMTLYSMNNMPYSALGGVMTGDVNERAQLNSYRFVSVNIAQFIVGGLTLPLVARFAVGSDRQHGWQMTMTVWAVLCLILFLITFFTTRERIQPVTEKKSSPKQDFADLLKNSPWIVMVFMTLVHFAILSFRGSALYNYYHSYADKAALYDFVHALGLTAPAVASGTAAGGGLLEWLGYIVHGTRDAAGASNVADVANSLINMLGTAVTIVVILLSPALSRRYGKKAVAITGFALTTVFSAAFSLLAPDNVAGMLILTVLGAICYAPTIPLVWAMYADVADYSEWKTGRRFTGIVFATIGFALKSGLALGSSSFLWIMSWFYDYDPQNAGAARALEGFRACSGLMVGGLFAVCTVLLTLYRIDKRLTHQIADELAARRLQGAAPSTP
jgi:GPH family glycoside/pentoside/hexuronide:cation symporter